VSCCENCNENLEGFKRQGISRRARQISASQGQYSTLRVFRFSSLLK